jgi:hypothetical protein
VFLEQLLLEVEQVDHGPPAPEQPEGLVVEHQPMMVQSIKEEQAAAIV